MRHDKRLLTSKFEVLEEAGYLWLFSIGENTVTTVRFRTKLIECRLRLDPESTRRVAHGDSGISSDSALAYATSPATMISGNLSRSRRASSLA
jgi:hypothetical protein